MRKNAKKVSRRFRGHRANIRAHRELVHKLAQASRLKQNGALETYQHDPRHVDVRVKELRLERANTVPTPAVGRHCEWKLGTAEPGQFARCFVLSEDRADITFTVKELCRRKSHIPRSWWGERETARQVFERRTACGDQYSVLVRWHTEMTACSDSDWAGDTETRPSSSAVMILVGSHSVESMHTQATYRSEKQCGGRNVRSDIGSTRVKENRVDEVDCSETCVGKQRNTWSASDREVCTHPQMMTQPVSRSSSKWVAMSKCNLKSQRRSRRRSSWTTSDGDEERMTLTWRKWRSHFRKGLTFQQCFEIGTIVNNSFEKMTWKLKIRRFALTSLVVSWRSHLKDVESKETGKDSRQPNDWRYSKAVENSPEMHQDGRSDTPL